MARALAWTVLSAFVLLVATTPNAGYQVSLYAAVGWRFVLLIAAATIFALDRSRSRLHDTVFAVVIGIVVVTLPSQLGYAAYGRADVPFHHAAITQVLAEGHLPSTLLYPAGHLLAAVLAHWTHLEPKALIMAFPLMRTVIFTVLAVFAVKALIPRQAPPPMLPSILLVLSGVGYSVLPSANAFADILVLAPLALIAQSRQPRLSWRLALVVFIFALIYAHPIVVIVLTSAILGLYGANRGRGRGRWVWLAAIPAVVFAQWFSSFAVFRQQARILRDFLVEEGRGTPVTRLVANIERADVSTSELLWIGFRTYGDRLLMAGAFALMLYVLIRIGGRRALGPYRPLLAFVIVTVALAVTAAALPIGGSLRYVTYVTIVLSIGLGVLASDIQLQSLVARWRPLLALVAITIWSLMVFGLYNDPYRRQVNEQVTRAELAQYGLLYEHVPADVSVGTILSTRLDRIIGWLSNSTLEDVRRFRWEIRTVLPDDMILTDDCASESDPRCVDIAFLPRADIVAYPEAFRYPRYSHSSLQEAISSQSVVYSTGDGYMLRRTGAR